MLVGTGKGCGPGFWPRVPSPGGAISLASTLGNYFWVDSRGARPVRLGPLESSGLLQLSPS